MSDLPLRPELVGQSAYGAPQIDVPVPLNTNENPYPPSEALVADLAERVARAARSANRYPDRDAVELRRALAHYLRSSTGTPVGPEQVWAANGSNEILQQILQAFGGPGRTALGLTPTYSMHELISRGTGTSWIGVPRRDGLGVSADEVVAAVRDHRPDVLFLCSPNNPTGQSVAPDVILAAYDAVVAGGTGILVVDEAYAEFASGPGAVGLLAGRPRLIVTRTMSKAFAFAAGRVGYLAADARVVDALQLVRLPYHLSAFTQAAALAALAHQDELGGQVATLCQTRDRFLAGLGDRGWVTAPTDANFVLVGPFRDNHEAWSRLLADGVLVRDVHLAGWLRFTIGTDEQMAAALSALDRLVDVREI